MIQVNKNLYNSITKFLLLFIYFPYQEVFVSFSFVFHQIYRIEEIIQKTRQSE